MEFGISEVEGLAKMLGVDRDEELEHEFGSTLNPGTLDGKSKDEIAKPRAKIDFKVNNRDAKGGMKEELLSEDVKAKKNKNSERDIWTEQEVNLQSEDIHDDRVQPDFDVLHKQSIGTEDVFLGLSGKDPSSNNSDALLIKIKLPGCKLKEIEWDVKEQSVHVQSPYHVLNHILPYRVDKEKSNAKWEQKNETLSLTLPILRKELIDEIMAPIYEYHNNKDKK